MRDLSGIWKVIAAVVVAAWAGKLIYTALTVGLHPVLQGALSMSAGLVLVFLLQPVIKNPPWSESPSLKHLFLYGKKDTPAISDILLAIVALIPNVYMMIHWEAIVVVPGIFEYYQLVLGALQVIVVMEATRRALGNIIPILVLLFVGYALFGHFIPGLFGHGGFPVAMILVQSFMMTEGIWGLLTDMTSRMIALFIIFGPVLFATGVGQSFIDLASFIGGRIRGGGGQVAVVSSAFFGTISGSSVANVATTGALTIPMMKRLGYPKAWAGAIEATASSGGQIMPPIMAAGAFVMAEFLGIPYLMIARAAIIPAIIFFFAVGIGVYVLAGKYGLGKLPPELIPKAREVLTPRRIILVGLPLGVLIYLLIQLLPPQMCAAWALLVSMVLFMVMGGSLSLRGAWERIKTLASAYYSAVAKTLAWLMVMMVCVQLAVTMIGMTGLAVKTSEVIVGLAGVHIMLALLLAMFTSLILGMGMTTTAAYVVAAAVAAPALIALGLPPIAVHMFIFYFAVISAITPPVCIAIYTAAAICDEHWTRVVLPAIVLGFGGKYVLPFLFIFEPAFLMDGELVSIVFYSFTALIGVFFLSVGLLGYWMKSTSILERLIFIAGGLALMHPSLLTDGIGLALAAGGWLSQRFMPPIPVIGTRPASRSASEPPSYSA